MNRSVPPPEPEQPAPSPSRKRGLPKAWWLVAAAVLAAVALLLVRDAGEQVRVAAPSQAADASAPALPPGPRGEVTIEGYVRDDTDAPLERAQVVVTLLEWPELARRTATTDVAGRFAIHDLPREPLLFAVAREGHEGDERTFRPGDPLALTFVLSRQGELMVLLRDEPGRVLEGAEVVLTGPELWPPRSERANAAGEVVFKGLAGGSYSARARKQERIAPPSTLQLVVPGERGRLELSLRPGERLTGTIVDGDSKRPLSGVKLSVQDSTPGIAPLEGASDAAGNFTLAGLWPVAIRLELSRDGYARGFEELKLPHPAPLALALRGAVALAGRVVDERGKPVANAAVSLSTHDELPLDLAPGLPGLIADSGVGELGVTRGDIPAIPVSSPSEGWGLGALATYTDASGRFRIEGLPPVPLLLSASRPGYAGATHALRDLAAHAERRDLELVLHAAGKVAGRLTDARGEPVSNVLVRAQSSSAEHSSTTDARGEFMLHDVLGEVAITATPAGYEAPHCRVNVLAGETARCDLRIGSPLFTLPVRVVDEFGLALEGAEITASFQTHAATGSKAQRSVTRLSGDDGTANLSELPAPPYKVDVEINGYVGVHELVVTSAERELRVVLRRAATLSGMVLDALGRPVPSALVTSEGAETSESESDGSFTLLGVVPGPHTLSAAHPRAGSGKSAELRARPSETLGGIRIVLSGRYQPLPDAGAIASERESEGEGEERAAKPDSTFAQRGRAVIVAEVAAATAAARAGLREGDVLQAIDGEPPLSAAHARGLLRDPAGKVANVRVLRQKKVVTLRYRRPPL